MSVSPTHRDLKKSRERDRQRCQAAGARDQDATRLALHLDVHAEQGIPLAVEREVERLMRELRA